MEHFNLLINRSEGVCVVGFGIFLTCSLCMRVAMGIDITLIPGC